MKRFRRALAGAALALLAAAGGAGARPFTDASGRVVDLPEHIARVWPAGPPAEALVYTLAPQKLIGWTHALPAEAKALMPDAYASLPVVGRLTGRGNTASLEAVVAKAPGLVLDIGTIGPTYVSLADRVQAQTHIPYVLLAGSLVETPTLLRSAGAAIGVSDRAEMLARYAEEKLGAIAQRITAIPPERRPKAYLARGPRGLLTDVKGSINGEVMDFVGAQNVVPGTGGGNLADVSLEQLLAWQPDVIVTVDRNFFAAVARDPNWAGVKAVRDKRVYLVPLYPFGWIDEPPGPNRIIGALWLAKLLYPDAFPEDIRAEAKRFYALFYPQPLGDQALDRLLGPPG